MKILAFMILCIVVSLQSLAGASTFTVGKGCVTFNLEDAAPHFFLETYPEASSVSVAWSTVVYFPSADGSLYTAGGWHFKGSLIYRAKQNMVVRREVRHEIVNKVAGSEFREKFDFSDGIRNTPFFGKFALDDKISTDSSTGSTLQEVKTDNSPYVKIGGKEYTSTKLLVERATIIRPYMEETPTAVVPTTFAPNSTPYDFSFLLPVLDRKQERCNTEMYNGFDEKIAVEKEKILDTEMRFPSKPPPQPPSDFNGTSVTGEVRGMLNEWGKSLQKNKNFPGVVKAYQSDHTKKYNECVREYERKLEKCRENCDRRFDSAYYERAYEANGGRFTYKRQSTQISIDYGKCLETCSKNFFYGYHC